MTSACEYCIHAASTRVASKGASLLSAVLGLNPPLPPLCHPSSCCNCFAQLTHRNPLAEVSGHPRAPAVLFRRLFGCHNNVVLILKFGAGSICSFSPCMGNICYCSFGLERRGSAVRCMQAPGPCSRLGTTGSSACWGFWLCRLGFVIVVRFEQPLSET